MDGKCEPVVYAIYAMRKVLGISRFGDLSIRPKEPDSHRKYITIGKPPDATVTESLPCDIYKMVYIS